MMKRFEIFLMVLQLPIDILMIFFSGLLAYYFRFSDWAIALKPVLFQMTIAQFSNVVLYVIPLIVLSFAFLGLYSPDSNRKWGSEFSRIFFGLLASLSVVSVYVMFTQQVFDSRFLVITGFGFALVCLTFARVFLRLFKRYLYTLGYGRRRVVLIGEGDIVTSLKETFEQNVSLGYEIVGVYDHFSLDVEKKVVRAKIDEIIFANARSNETEALQAIDCANEHHFVFKYSADLFSTYSANSRMYPIGEIPIVEIKRTPLEGWGAVVKRIFDIVVSIFFIIVLSPIMLLTAFIIYFETGRPIIYKNERVGLRAKNFFTFKFRSMFVDDCTGAQFGESGLKAEEKEKTLIKTNSIKDGPLYKIANDPRITPFGNFIRRSSIDELPQFFNVLLGNMSIVGPRPHQPREIEKYKKEHRKVFTLKPGITGLAQISGRSDLSFEEEHRLDVLYIEKWNLLLDIIILLKTPFVLFKKRKAL